MDEFRVDRLTAQFGVPPSTAMRWCREGLIRAENRGPGRGRGFFVTKDGAREAAALFLLHERGVPFNRLREAVDKLRREDKRGADFLCLGVAANGRTVLVDGDGSSVPLRDGAGQFYLNLAVLDLRSMRERVDAVICEAREERDARRQRVAR